VPFQVYLTPTTASPPDAQVQSYVRAAIAAEGGSLGPDGVALRTSDGAKVIVASDAEHFEVDQLSPSFCRMLFSAALRSNSTIERGGADVTPLKMKGSRGATRYLRLRTDPIASPTELCARLQRDLEDWNRFVRDAKSDGVLGPDGEFLEPPAAPGIETRLSSDPSGVAERCQADFAKLGWKIIRSVVSRNTQYGVVWRADVALPGRPHNVSRTICWRRPGQDGPGSYSFEDRPLEMFDPAQSVAPLEP
jgi:hypothetical protein